MVRSALVFALATCLTGHALGISVSVQVLAETCAGNDGAAMATVSGGVPPYTYAWSNASTTNPVTGLTQGSYSVTVMDQMGATATRNFIVSATSDLNDLYPSYIATEGLEPCAGMCNGGFRLHLLRRQGGYSFITVPASTYNELPEDEPSGLDYYVTYEFLGPFCENSTVALTITTGNGCSGGTSEIPIGQAIVPDVQVQEVTGSCTTGNDGTITVQVTVPFTVGWFDLAVDDQQGTLLPGDGFGPGTNTEQISGLHPGDWSLRLTSNNGSSFQAPCVYTVPFTVPDLGADCGLLSGNVHFETDMDCTLDGSEVGLPFRVLRVSPGPQYAITAQDGGYSVGVPYGSYTLEQMDPAAVQLCPAPVPVPFTVTSGSPYAVIDLSDSLLTPFDMGVHLIHGIPRPGFVFEYAVDLANATGHPGDDIEVTLQYDPLFTYVNATPAPAQNQSGSITWSLPQLGPFAPRHFSVYLQVPADPLLIGTTHAAVVNATSSTAEGTLTNNSYAVQTTVQGAYDPNAKECVTSTRQSADAYFLGQDAYIDYLVRFQNTGTDTAFTVVVTDTIGPLLDLATLRILGASHAFVPSIHAGRELRFTFPNILLADSTTNEPASHGYVAFRLTPIAGIGPGQVIGNAADIYFDLNPPVRTDTALLVTEISTGIAGHQEGRLQLSPVPVIDLLRVSDPTRSLTHIEILASDGRLVHAGPASPVLDLSDLGAGVYILKAQYANGDLSWARFVKR